MFSCSLFSLSISVSQEEKERTYRARWRKKRNLELRSYISCETKNFPISVTWNLAGMERAVWWAENNVWSRWKLEKRSTDRKRNCERWARCGEGVKREEGNEQKWTKRKRIELYFVRSGLPALGRGFRPYSLGKSGFSLYLSLFPSLSTEKSSRYNFQTHRPVSSGHDQIYFLTCYIKALVELPLYL